ncbi:MAG: hypothetical protein IT168_21485 [Bryobacterales bacterium]|nr:hypothetical protein [Bryobacterales bacterium]
MTDKRLNCPGWARLGLVTLAATLWAQGPITDQVMVNFSSPVMVGNNVLAPGEYKIRQLPTAANPRILEFSSNNGTKVQATVTAIAALDQLNMRPTSVEVDHGNGTAYVKRVWIEGKSYGYELLPPSQGNTMEARNLSGIRITGNYTPENQQVAQARTTPAETAAPAPTPAPAPVATPQETPRTTPPDTQNQQTTTAAATPPDTNTNRTDSADAQSRTTTSDQNVPSLSGQTPADTAATTTTAGNRMPRTAAGWPATMLTGFFLAGAGLLVRRFRR